MSQFSQMSYAHPGLSAASAGVSERMAFIRRTYLHLFGSILLFVLIEAALFVSGLAAPVAMTLANSWIIVFSAFVGVSFLANWWAMRDTSPALQYAGLGLFIVMEAIIFLPLLYLAIAQGGGIDGGGLDVVISAGSLTAIMCGVVTIFVFVTKKDFSFMGWALGLCSIATLVLIVLSLVFGWPLGAWFSGMMIVLGLGYLLYQTSNVLHHYRTNQHVAASLALFASVMMVFFYVLRLFMSRD